MNVIAIKNNISLDGHVILENAEKGKVLLLAALEKIDGSKSVIINLESLNKIDSSGLQVLLAFIKKLQGLDCDFELKKVQKSIADLIVLSGLNKFLIIKAEEVIGYT